MQAADIQRIVLDAFYDVQILRSHLRAMSDEPAESGGRIAVPQPTFYCSGVMERQEFLARREQCRRQGVWITWQHTQTREYDVFVYDMTCVPCR